MRNLLLPVLLSAATLIGCGANVVNSNGTTGSTGGTTTGGGSGTTTGAATAGNYPNPPQGYGVTVNRVIQNFNLPGYLSTTDTAIDNSFAYVDTLSLQDFRTALDANGQPFRFLLLDISAGWCSPCNAEAQDLGLQGADKTKIAEWLGKGGLMFTVLVEGYNESTHALPVRADLDTWTNQHDVPYTMGWDPTGALLNQGISPSAFPTNLVIDLKTMEIVSAWYGIDTTYQKWEAALNATP